MIAAVVAVVVLGELHRRAMGGLFEDDNTTLFARLEPLWGLLACRVPGIGVGLFMVTGSSASELAIGEGAACKQDAQHWDQNEKLAHDPSLAPSSRGLRP
jgi:hypothetical protein